MRQAILRAAVAAVLPLCGLSVHAADRCGPDTISTGGFESVAGVRMGGAVGGLQAGTVEVRGGEQVFFSGTVDAGAFLVELPPMAPEQMLELRVRGVDAQDFIELAAYVGTVQQVLDQADGDGIARVAGLPTLRVNAESTARYALAQATFGAQAPVIAHECQLAAVDAGLDPVAVSERAAVIKILIEDGGIAPAAVAAKGTTTTTLGVVQDPSTYQATVTNIEAIDPGRIAAMQTLLNESFCAYFDNDAILLHPPRASGEVMNQSNEHLFRRIDATNGSNIQRYGADAYTWACEGDVANVDFVGNRVSVSFPYMEVNGEYRQVHMEYRELDATLTWVDSGTEFVTVSMHASYEYSYPYEPTLETEYQSGEGLLVLMRQSSGTLFQEATVPGEYLMPTSGLYGDEAANRVRLDAGGVGEDLDANAPVTWLVTPEGALMVDFVDRTAFLAPVRDEAANVHDVLSAVELDSGEATVGQYMMLRRTFPAGWADDGAVAGEYRQHDYQSSEPGYKFDFLANHDAPSFNYFASTGELRPSLYFYWSRPAADTMVLRVCEHFDGTNYSRIAVVDREPDVGECNSWYRRRTWTLYTSEGSLLYVRELNEDWYADPTGGQGPDFRFDRSMMYGYTAPPPAGAVVGKADVSGDDAADGRVWPVGVLRHALEQ